MDEGQVVYSFRRNQDEEVRFTVRAYKQRGYLDIRIWFQPSDGGEYRPARKGITLGLEHLLELKKGLEQAGKAAVEMPLHKASNSVK